MGWGGWKEWGRAEGRGREGRVAVRGLAGWGGGLLAEGLWDGKKSGCSGRIRWVARVAMGHVSAVNPIEFELRF